MNELKSRKMISILVIFSMLSFFLGKMSVNASKNDNENPIIFKIDKKTTKKGGRVVSSINSNYFHLLYCPGASRIKESNKVYYESKEKALEIGLVPAKNCKGI